MKGLITYSSQTGNTEKVAKTIYEYLSDNHDVDIQAVDEIDDIDAYDYILHGIWVRMTDLDKASKKFLKSVPQGTKVGLFGTSGGEHASEHSKRLNEHIKKTMEPFDSLGVKLTFGKVDEKIIDKVDSIIGNLLPKKMKAYIKEMSIHSREATDEERLEIARYFFNILDHQ